MCKRALRGKKGGHCDWAVEESRGQNVWGKVREVGMGQNMQGLWATIKGRNKIQMAMG